MLKRAAGTRLFLLTSLPAVDGTLFALGASGGLATPAGAALAGLTVIAGAGAWLAAREEFGRGRGGAAAGPRTLLAIAALSTALTVAAVAAGAFVGARLDLAVLPTAAGAALLALAAETAGARLPRFAGLPVATLAIGAGAVVEVARWML